MIRMINAIRKKDGSAVLKLLNQGMDPNKIYREGDTSRGFLSFAIEAGDEKIVRLLLEKAPARTRSGCCRGKRPCARCMKAFSCTRTTGSAGS